MKKNTITLIASSGLFTNFLWRFRHDFCCTFRKNNTSNHASYTITRIFIWKNSAFWHFSQKGSFLPPALASRKRKWYDISGAFFFWFFLLKHQPVVDPLPKFSPSPLLFPNHRTNLKKRSRLCCVVNRNRRPFVSSKRRSTLNGSTASVQVIHYCMGGLLIDTDSACIGANDKPIKGLYAAGEVRKD